MKDALCIEIESIKSLEKGFKTKLINGELKKKVKDKFIYLFETANNIMAIEESPATLEVDKINYKCTIIYIGDKKVELQLDKDIGKKISKATLLIETWFLLDLLNQRFREDSTETIYSKSVDLFRFSQKEINLKVNEDLLTDFQTNLSQRKAVKETFKNSINFIWGPPGTGKTTTIATIISLATKSGFKVLLLSLANNAVDQAMIKSVKSCAQLLKSGKLVRVGTPKSNMIDIYKKLSNSVFPIDIAEKKLSEEVEERESKISLVKGYKKKHDFFDKLIIFKNKVELAKLDRKNIIKLNDMSSDIDEKQKLLYNFDKYLNYSLTELYRERNIQKQRITEIYKRIEEINYIIDHEKQQVIYNASLVATTITKAYIDKAIRNMKFDIVIIDEVSMVPLPMVYWAASRTKSNITLVGDFKQLLPICRSDDELVKEWYKKNIYDFLGINSIEEAMKRTILLDTQYRMHPDISMLTNKFVYGNRLNDSVNVLENIHIDNVSNDRSVTFINTEKAKPFCSQAIPSGRFNIYNAFLCYILVKEISMGNNKNLSYGVVTPYKHQARLIDYFIRSDRAINDMKVIINTIHSFQGGEETVIIFDTVDTHGPKKWSMLNEDNYEESNFLLNVAITRAKNKLYIIGDKQYLFDNLESRMLLRKIIESLKSNTFVDSNIIMPFIDNRIPSKNNFNNDILEAKQNVTFFINIVSIKENLNLGDFENLLKKIIKNNVKITIITNDYAARDKTDFYTNFKKYQNMGVNMKICEKKSCEKLTIIDYKKIWFGSLDARNSTKYGYLFEISNTKIVSLLIDFYDIYELNDLENLNGKVCPVCQKGFIVYDDYYLSKDKFFRCRNSDCKYTWNLRKKWSDL